MNPNKVCTVCYTRWAILGHTLCDPCLEAREDQEAAALNPAKAPRTIRPPAARLQTMVERLRRQVAKEDSARMTAITRAEIRALCRKHGLEIPAEAAVIPLADRPTWGRQRKGAVT